MREVFRNELDDLATQLVGMSAKVLDAIRLANQSLHSNDLELAEQVIEADSVIDNMQFTLDQQAAEMLALQAPVAADLRAVIGSLRMSASLERMGDLARHIAQQVRIRYPESAIPDLFEPTFAGWVSPVRRSPRRRRACSRIPAWQMCPRSTPSTRSSTNST